MHLEKNSAQISRGSGALTADELRALVLTAWPDATVNARDDSAKHAGHAGQKGHGGGHYHLTVIWTGFATLTRVERQRAVHAVLADAFAAKKIHALSLTLATAGSD